MSNKKILASYSEEQRLKALKKFRLLQPYLKKENPLSKVSEENDISTRTLRKWISYYKKSGLVGLIAKERSDKNSMKISKDLCKIIKHIYTL